MEKFKKLLEAKGFERCYDEQDVIKALDEANGSREFYYLRKDGVGTFNVKDNVEITKGVYCDKCEGYYNSVVGGEHYQVYIDIYLDGWDDETENYTIVSFIEKGWE